MNQDEFVNIVNKHCAEESIRLHEALLRGGITPHMCDEWKTLIMLYNELDQDRKKAFLFLIEFVSLNSVALVLAVLDGTSSIEETEKGFHLIENGSDQLLNEELVGPYWELQKEKGRAK